VSCFDFDQTLLVNVRSNVHFMSLCFPFMKQNDKAQRSSSITVLTSSSCNRADPGASIMSISSAMVKQMIQCTALEGAYHNIRVNAVAAGVTDTRARMN